METAKFLCQRLACLRKKSAPTAALVLEIALYFRKLSIHFSFLHSSLSPFYQLVAVFHEFSRYEISRKMKCIKVTIIPPDMDA
jgi:hypothetical protein